MGFLQDFKKAEKELFKNLSTVYKVAGINLFNAIVLLSAVDTGRFRGNWQATINSPSDKILYGNVPTGQKIGQTENIKNKLKQATLDDILFLVNNLPYAEALEMGHSGQMPRGSVRLAAQDAQRALDKAVKKVFK